MPTLPELPAVPRIEGSYAPRPMPLPATPAPRKAEPPIIKISFGR
jgi:hypothetical protein